MKEYIKPEIEIIECEPSYAQCASTYHGKGGWIKDGKWKPGNMAEEGWKEYIGYPHPEGWTWVDTPPTLWEEEEDI